MYACLRYVNTNSSRSSYNAASPSWCRVMVVLLFLGDVILLITRQTFICRKMHMHTTHHHIHAALEELSLSTTHALFCNDFFPGLQLHGRVARSAQLHLRVLFSAHFSHRHHRYPLTSDHQEGQKQLVYA